MAQPEVWLRGPVPGYAAQLQPVAHALLQVQEDEVRAVGRARLPATVRGLLCHAAEHSTRHLGQALTLVRVLG